MYEDTRHAFSTAAAERLKELLHRNRDDGRSKPPDCCQLGFWGGIGHYDRALDSELSRAPSGSLGHVARTGGPDALTQLLRLHLGEKVDRSADFEGAYRLEVLQLQIDFSRGVV
jgi:hypothetical protein